MKYIVVLKKVTLVDCYCLRISLDKNGSFKISTYSFYKTKISYENYD